MSEKYVPNIIYETEFQGEKVKAHLEPLDRSTFLLLQSEFAKRGVTTPEKAKALPPTEFADVGSQVLRKALKKIDGLTDAGGMPISVDTVIDKMFFNPLVMELFIALFERANVGKVMSSASEGKFLGSSTERESTISS